MWNGKCKIKGSPFHNTVEYLNIAFSFTHQCVAAATLSAAKPIGSN